VQPFTLHLKVCKVPSGSSVVSYQGIQGALYFGFFFFFGAGSSGETLCEGPAASTTISGTLVEGVPPSELVKLLDPIDEVPPYVVLVPWGWG
jgi:hypothetical protein